MTGIPMQLVVHEMSHLQNLFAHTGVVEVSIFREPDGWRLEPDRIDPDNIAALVAGFLAGACGEVVYLDGDPEAALLGGGGIDGLFGLCDHAEGDLPVARLMWDGLPYQHRPEVVRMATDAAWAAVSNPRLLGQLHGLMERCRIGGGFTVRDMQFRTPTGATEARGTA